MARRLREMYGSEMKGTGRQLDGDMLGSIHQAYLRCHIPHATHQDATPFY